MNKKKIFLIENQLTQFRDIRFALKSGGFEVYPDEENFKSLIDLVRINLNPRYDKDLRDEVLVSIIEEVKIINPDLLIIDHILVGNDSADDGIDLAKRLHSILPPKPILFFSRSPHNSFFIIEKLSTFHGEYEWVAKGYWGNPNLEESIFTKVVFPKIDILLSQSKDPENTKTKLIDLLTRVQKDVKGSNSRFPGKQKIASQTLIDDLLKLLPGRKVFNEEQLGKMYEALKALSDKGENDTKKWIKQCDQLKKILDEAN